MQIGTQTSESLLGFVNQGKIVFHHDNTRRAKF
jgi:hypothetical protein